MDSWEDIRAGLDALLRLLAAGLIGLAVYAIKALLPLARAALAEFITTRAWRRWSAAAESRAAEILDPDNPVSSVKAAAADMLAGVPDAAQVLGGTQAAAERAIQREVSKLKVGDISLPVAPAVPLDVLPRSATAAAQRGDNVQSWAGPGR